LGDLGWRIGSGGSQAQRHRSRLAWIAGSMDPWPADPVF
jgi:hypothetical protein